MADQDRTSGELADAPVVQDVLQGGRESIIDYMHISPIKVGSQTFIQSQAHIHRHWLSVWTPSRLRIRVCSNVDKFWGVYRRKTE